MPDLLDLASDEQPEHPEFLDPVRLGLNPTHLLFFTSKVETVHLHYVEGPPVNGYVVCPGDGCPACYVGQLPSRTHLLPVLHIGRRAVQVLRVSDNRSPGSLLAGLLPHLSGEGISEKLFTLARSGSAFTVKVQALGEHADRGLPVIKGFLEAREQGLSLRCAFPDYSAAELAEVPSIHSVLDAVGGWTAPRADDSKDPKGHAGE